MRKILFILILVSAVLGFIPSGSAAAQQPQPGRTPSADEVNAIASQLYCPVCENIPLDVCPTQACEDWRNLIRQMLIEGKSEQEIKDYFVAQYGDRVLGTPPARGLTLNWLMYLVPPVVILAGILVLFRAMKEWQRPQKQAVDREKPAVEADDDYVRKLEEELRKG